MLQIRVRVALRQRRLLDDQIYHLLRVTSSPSLVRCIPNGCPTYQRKQKEMGRETVQEWLDRSNRHAMVLIERQARTATGLIPFLGAGISMAFGYKNWGDLLLNATPPALKRKMAGLLERGKYEEAAESLLKRFGPDGFQDIVATAAGDHVLANSEFRSGTVSLLPLLGGGPAITTNFDRVLEKGFAVNGAPFEAVISGPRPDQIVDALHSNEHALIKLHGDWQDRVGRTFTKSDYDANYGLPDARNKRELLESVERLLFSSRSLLFIGASLAEDRTVKMLKKVHAEYAAIRHFAIVPVPDKKKELAVREAHFGECGVVPLWYQPTKTKGHGDCIEELLQQIIERSSVQTLRVASNDKSKASSSTRSAVPPFTLFATPDPAGSSSSEASKPADGDLTAHFDRIARQIEDGRITFFLGAAIHAPTRLLASDFYQTLASIFDCDALVREQFAVSQYIADLHGRDALDHEIKKLFEYTTLVRRETHEFFASWSSFNSKSGVPLPYPTIFTTNYDCVLEETLSDADLPFHLFSYQASGTHAGLFYHRSPDDGLRIIERPENIRSLAPGFVVVKLNGGIDYRKEIPETFVNTRLDYWDLASRIPRVFPQAISQVLSNTQLLFLGHGLAAQDVEATIRFAHQEHRGPRSWAVTTGDQDRRYWNQCGIEIVNQTVASYVQRLQSRLVGRK
ncbi:SIR2 family protein [Paraburkholderia sp. C35]|uniref:SIR2 family protein n=1 Tax=Paraburkholderia sp. C35 TaxID=2126993 RepID=UPI0013A584FE|nr:SIR2 family protein [Paraburkholderia sp. C35]